MSDPVVQKLPDPNGVVLIEQPSSAITFYPLRCCRSICSCVRSCVSKWAQWLLYPRMAGFLNFIALLSPSLHFPPLSVIGVRSFRNLVSCVSAKTVNDDMNDFSWISPDWECLPRRSTTVSQQSNLVSCRHIFAPSQPSANFEIRSHQEDPVRTLGWGLYGLQLTN